MVDREEARKRLRRFIAERDDPKEGIDAPKVAHEAVNAFKDDQELLAALVYPMVYEEVMSYLKETRHGAVVQLEDGRVIDGATAVRGVWGREPKFARWREWNGKRHLPFMRLARNDCFAAAKARRKRERAENILATLLERLGACLKEGEVIEDRFTPQQIEEMEKQITDELYGQERKAI